MKTKTFNKRTFYAIGAAVIALCIVIGGVFAWYDNSQHKTNIITGNNKMTRDDVVLIEDFEPPEDWQQGDELKKEVYVKNTGDGQVFVRLQLKEYMDIAKETYIYSDERLMVDKDGKFMSWADKAAAKTWLEKDNIPFTEAQLVEYIMYGDTVKRVYFATNENTPLNGRDGKKMLLEYKQDAPKSLVDGITRAAYMDTDDHRLHPTGECKYTPHLWNGTTFAGGKDTAPNKDPFHEYVEMKLGTPLKKLSEWDGQPFAGWLLDDTSAEGWAYWGQAVNPGESTAKLLESIKLIKQPDGPFYYALHVDMQAVDSYQLMAKFDGIPDKVADSYRGKIGFNITAGTFTTTQGGTVKFTATYNGEDVTADVTWPKPERGTASGVGTLTDFNQPGVLTIGPAQPLGSLIISANYTTSGETFTAKYVVTVK